jgi:outer membrane immunogenic protein
MLRKTSLAALISFAISGPALANGPGPFSWTGFYVGAHLGAVLNGDSVYTYTKDGNFEPKDRPRPVDVDGALPGLQVGYMHQFGAVVVGGELSGSWGRADGLLLENPCPCPGGNDYRTTTEQGALYMATGRIGFAMDRVLLYAKGGWAWTETDFQATFQSPPGSNTLTSIKNTFNWDGFVWGAGIEMALSRNITFGVEYMRVDFGSSGVVTLPVTNSGITTETLRATYEIDTLTARLNYKF